MQIVISLNKEQEIGRYFECLYDEHSDRMLSYLMRRGLQRADAEELAQEVWTKAWRFREQFDGSNFVSWLYRIARNCVIDASRKSASRTGRLGRLELAMLLDSERQVHTAVVEQLIRDEEYALARRCLQNGDSVYLEALLAQLEGEPVTETAARMGISENTVYSRRNRGKRMLSMMAAGA